MANVSLCGATITSNTGEILCDVSKGKGKKLFIWNGSMTPAQFATAAAFQTNIAAFSKLSRSAANKIFPIPEMQEIADASEANTEASLGLGFKQVINEGKPAYTIKLFAGSTLAKKLRKFNNQTVRILELDSNNRVWGTKSGNNFVGYLAKMFFTGQKLATGQAVEEGIITLTLSIMDTSEYNDNSFYQDITNVTAITGLLDANLIEAAARAANVYKIAVKVPTAQLGVDMNLYDQISTQAAATAMWEAMATTPAGVTTVTTITSVAVDAALKAFTITFDSTQYAAYPAGTVILAKMKDPEVLDAADITNIESVAISLVK